MKISEYDKQSIISGQDTLVIESGNGITKSLTIDDLKDELFTWKKSALQPNTITIEDTSNHDYAFVDENTKYREVLVHYGRNNNGMIYGGGSVVLNKDMIGTRWTLLPVYDSFIQRGTIYICLINNTTLRFSWFKPTGSEINGLVKIYYR